MDIMQIWSSYRKDADPESIFPLYKECDINAKAKGYGDLNLLHIACQNAHPEAITWLLEQGLNPNEASGYGDLPLFNLAKKSFSAGYVPREGDIYRSAKALLDAGASVMRRDSDDKFCYHHAAEAGNVEFLRALAEHGAKLNKTDRDRNTGLHLIAQAHYNPLENLKRVDKEIEEKRNEASLPEKQRSPISMEELERRKKAIEDELENLFRCAVILMDAGVDPEAENDMLETAHKLAVRMGAKKLAALLDGSYSPEEGDSPDAQKKIAAGGMTLHQAVLNSDETAVRTLVEMGGDINAVSEDENFAGLSPLAVACRTCNIPMASLLLELGADPSRKDGAGHQPIVALFSPQIMIHGPRNLYSDRLAEQLVKLLVHYGFDPDSSLDNEGNCLLGMACSFQNGRGFGRDSVSDMVVEAAIRSGADVNRKNDAGQTPLMLSCTCDFRTMEAVQTALLEAGADVTLRDGQGNTVLHYAACNPSRQDALFMAELILDFGDPDADTVNSEGKTAMDYAVERDNTPLVKLLLPYMK